MRTIKTTLFLVALAGVGLASLGCQTTEGFGRDMESLGDTIADEAEEERND